MNLKAFFAAPSGRLFAATTALALLGAGGLALMGPETPLGLLAMLILAIVVCSILLVGMATQQFWREALILVLALPPVGGLYFAGLTVVGEIGAVIGVPLLVLGLVPAYVAVRPKEGASSEPRQAVKEAKSRRLPGGQLQPS